MFSCVEWSIYARGELVGRRGRTRLSAEGYAPELIHTEARVRLGRDGEGYAISRIYLRTEAEVPGVDEELFLEKADAAKRDCAVSKALAGVEEVNLEAKLVERTG